MLLSPMGSFFPRRHPLCYCSFRFAKEPFAGWFARIFGRARNASSEMKSRRREGNSPGDETWHWNLSGSLRPEYFTASPPPPSPSVTPLAILIHFPGFCWDFSYRRTYLMLARWKEPRKTGSGSGKRGISVIRRRTCRRNVSAFSPTSSNLKFRDIFRAKFIEVMYVWCHVVILFERTLETTNF